MRCIGPKTEVNFAYFGLESGMVFIRELGECTNVFTVSILNMSKKEGEDRDDKNQPCTRIYMYLRRVLLGVLGWSVPPGSPNPDPISDQNMSFFTPVFKPGL